MPERVIRLAELVGEATSEKLRDIEGLSRSTKLLALNALIESARFGAEGATFAVVAREVGAVATSAKELSEDLSGRLTPLVEELAGLGRRLVGEVRGERLSDLALTAVELIDRNLYERSCDVRWWATDPALTAGCVEASDPAATAHAGRRLGVILDSYTVYLDLWLTDLSGTVIAHGRPGRYPSVAGSSVAGEQWFADAVATASGGEYAVAAPAHIAALDAPAAVYATAVRRDGADDGEPIGVLGILFDWRTQAQAIVQGLRMAPEDRDRTRALLLDGEGLVLAASDGRGVLTERFDLRAEEKAGGYYTRDDGSTVGFALTPGYETYAGLGWYGALVQQPRG
jgi:hypothetical protein